LNRPTQLFIGVGTNALVDQSADWVATGVATAPEFFDGTGLKQGDVVPFLVGYEYDGLWTPGASPEVPVGLQVLGRARVIPGSPPPDQYQFSARYDWAGPSQARVGRLSTTIETLQVGPTWTLYVNLVSSERTVYLQYETSADPIHQYKVGPDTYVVIPLGGDFTKPGWRPLERDVAADYTAAFGKPPDDLRIAALVTRGSLALEPVSLTAPDGSVTSAAAEVGQAGETTGWRVVDGTGTVNLQTTDPSGHPAVVLQATLSEARRSDEADTVVINNGSGGLVVAVGTIQWSWALDGYGRHLDSKGNETRVDPRIQALTRNILRQIIASGRKGH